MGGTSADEVVVGWIGLGIMGEAMCTRLINAGHKVVVWNRTAAKVGRRTKCHCLARRRESAPPRNRRSRSRPPQQQQQQQQQQPQKNQCAPLVALGAEAAASPADVIARAAITFGMLADPPAALAAATEGDGCVAAGLRRASASASAGLHKKKMYVDMSTVDAETSAAVGDAVTKAGGLYLEAPVSGSKGPAQQGQLVIMAAGDPAVFAAAADPYFSTMGKRALHLSDDVGAAARMKLVVNGVMGAMMAAFCEGNALAQAAGLRQADLAEILSLGAMACPMFALKAGSVQARAYPPAFPLKHQQKDLRLALALGDAVGQPTPVSAAANELYKLARAKGRADDDFAAVYEAVAVAEAGAENGGGDGKRARA
jgi:glyoxylate/succinic semialdehyde reductase